MIENQQLSAGIVGLGRMGLRHLDVLRSLGIRVVGLADRSEEALAAARAQGAEGAAAYEDGCEMLAALRPEAVVVATTAPSHERLVLAAAEAGARYILCEKPIATSLDEADRMIAGCRASGSVLAVNHQMRFMPQYTEVKRLIGSEAFGPLSSLVVAASNFGLAMNASHYFEMFRFMTDTPVDRINAWFDDELVPNPRGAEFEDRSGRVLARNAAGQGMYIDLDGAAGWGITVTYICRQGQIQIDELSGEMRLASREAQYRDLPTTRYGMPVERRTKMIPPADSVAPTKAVWDAILAGESFPSGEDGLHALQCLVAAHLSHEAGGATVPLAMAETHRGRHFAWA